MLITRRIPRDDAFVPWNVPGGRIQPDLAHLRPPPPIGGDRDLGQNPLQAAAQVMAGDMAALAKAGRMLGQYRPFVEDGRLTGWNFVPSPRLGGGLARGDIPGAASRALASPGFMRRLLATRNPRQRRDMVTALQIAAQHVLERRRIGFEERQGREQLGLRREELAQRREEAGIRAREVKANIAAQEAATDLARKKFKMDREIHDAVMEARRQELQHKADMHPLNMAILEKEHAKLALELQTAGATEEARRTLDSMLSRVVDDFGAILTAAHDYNTKWRRVQRDVALVRTAAARLGNTRAAEEIEKVAELHLEPVRAREVERATYAMRELVGTRPKNWQDAVRRILSQPEDPVLRHRFYLAAHGMAMEITDGNLRQTEQLLRQWHVPAEVITQLQMAELQRRRVELDAERHGTNVLNQLLDMTYRTDEGPLGIKQIIGERMRDAAERLQGLRGQEPAEQEPDHGKALKEPVSEESIRADIERQMQSLRNRSRQHAP